LAGNLEINFPLQFDQHYDLQESRMALNSLRMPASSAVNLLWPETW